MSYGWAKDAEALTRPFQRTEIDTSRMQDFSGTPRSYLWIETDEDGNVELDLAQVDNPPCVCAGVSLTPDEARALAAALLRHAAGHVVVTDPTDKPET